MATLPVFIPLSEAARKYGLDEDYLRQMVEKGKIRAAMVAGEMVVSEEQVKERAERENGTGKKKEDLPEYSQFTHLQGKKINIRKASETYNIPFSTLRGWVKKGVIKKIEETERDIFLDEADVAYCSIIHERVKGRGRRVFASNGTPYKNKSKRVIL